MKPLGTAVAPNHSTKHRLGRKLAARRSSLLLVALFSLLLTADAAMATHTGPPFFLVYGVAQGSGPVAPGSFPQDSNGRPLIPPVSVQIGAAPLAVDVYFHNWASSPAASDEGSACNPDPAGNGSDAAGHEVCGWHVVLVANSGLQITAFTPASGDVKHVLTDDPAGDFLNVTGGTPLAPPGGVAVRIGTVRVSASSINQSLESRPGGTQSVSFVNAALVPRAAPVSIIASSLNTCGDATIVSQPPEECDDGATASGDGCYRNCQHEADISLQGAATASGDVQLSVEGVDLVVPTVFGETAKEVIENLVDFVNTNAGLLALGISAEQVDASGERLVTDGSLGTATSNTPGLTFVPEPSGWLMLATGFGFLAAVGRRRCGR
jgi:cysteine-rich repeat protein